MRWRFIDRLEAFEAWTSIRGRKTVSLEEYCLLEPLGRKGCCPESLILESCVQLVRWLAAASSDFQQSCLLLEARRFAFEHETNPGDRLAVAATVLDRRTDTLGVECEARIGGQRCGHGELVLSLVPLLDLAVEEDTRALWRELYAKA